MKVIDRDTLSLARWRSRLVSVLFGKCRQTCLVIPKLGVWNSHGRAVKPMVRVQMMDGLWEARFSQSCGESMWAVAQAFVIDVVLSCHLIHFLSSLLLHLF